MLSIALFAVLGSAISEWGGTILLVLIGVAAVIVAKGAKQLSATLPGIKFEVGQINKAVNRVAPGEPPLIEQVRGLHRRQNRQEELTEERTEIARAERLTILETLQTLQTHMENVDAHMKRQDKQISLLAAAESQ